MRAYKCSADRLTIGYGHVIKDNEIRLMLKEISKEGNKLLEEDIKGWEEYLNEICKSMK